ncbi:DEAD/DEAH box helicase [Terrilactibacillus sp. BCM23-1]|uniref:DEAD/DEAH box helicase n=1 Tax=Terrilactibacillus tamarindi TaxID=2599694 RepID=A0A6N8CS24_9BACI|nr:DEAD/DEAH box helicase [Terrilactibacillus tamarindi]MTT32851.1 DEAD/DEAH box helicase [Terrilactibacillus tamarindi]
MTQWAFLNKVQPFLKENFIKANFTVPTEVQEQTAETIMEGKDLIAESPTGTGKTLAYVLPLLEKINTSTKNPQVVILAPSRELVMQIYQVILDWKKGSDIQALSLIGGANIKKQLENIKKKGPHIIVGSPGRIYEIIKMKKLKMHEVKTIVLDEVDQLVVSEHVGTVKDIIKSTLRDRQILCYSATLRADVEKTLLEITNDAIVMKFKLKKKDSGKVKHQYIVASQRDKVKVLQKLSHIEGMQALVFVRDIAHLATYAEKLEFHHVRVGVLHSEVGKVERSQILKAFKEGKYTLLLATDVAARGLDIKDLPYVIQTDTTKEETYIHRSGRTGRAGKKGTVISLVTPSEVSHLKKLAKQIKIDIQEIVLSRGKLEVR